MSERRSKREVEGMRHYMNQLRDSGHSVGEITDLVNSTYGLTYSNCDTKYHLLSDEERKKIWNDRSDNSKARQTLKLAHDNKYMDRWRGEYADTDVECVSDEEVSQFE